MSSAAGFQDAEHEVHEESAAEHEVQEESAADSGQLSLSGSCGDSLSDSTHYKDEVQETANDVDECAAPAAEVYDDGGASEADPATPEGAPETDACTTGGVLEADSAAPEGVPYSDPTTPEGAPADPTEWNTEGNCGTAVEDAQDGGNSLAVSSGSHPPPAKRKKGPPAPKNAVQLLSEMRHGLQFEYVSVGPSHQPMFTATVEVDGGVYSGTGRTKKLAKHAVCELALQTMKPAVVSQDAPVLAESADTAPVETSLKRKRPLLTPADNQKTPLMLVHEKFPGGYYDLQSESGPSNNKTFVISLTIGGQQFIGTGRNKRHAKHQAAVLALQALLDGYHPPLQPGKDQ